MKKIVAFFSVVAIAATVLVSCSKKGDYTCTCTWEFGGQSMSQSVTFHNVKKSQAESSCDVSYFAQGVSGSCELE